MLASRVPFLPRLELPTLFASSVGTLRYAVVLVAALGLLPSTAAANYLCNPSCAPGKFWVGAGTSYYFDDNVPAEWRTAFDTAANDWNSGHANYGISGMYLNPGSSGLRVVMQVPPGCSNCPGGWDGENLYVNPNIAHNASQKIGLAMHEFGHQLGFGDVYGCDWGTVMGQSINSPNYLTDHDYCGLNSYYDPSCEAGGGYDEENHCTPLVLSFRGLPRLSGPEVPFDIAGTGDYPLCGWLQRPVDGLLVLDRDGDGFISSGKELFGNATPFASGSVGSATWSGFTALEFFDRLENGGNGNHLIDKDDSVFPKLRVWFDRNRDGISQPFELVRLKALGVQHIGLDGQAMDHVDQHGNVLWFGTSFTYRVGGVSVQGNVIDVIFKVR